MSIVPSFSTVLLEEEIPIESFESPLIIPLVVLCTESLSTSERFLANIPIEDVLPEAIFMALLFSSVSTCKAPASTSPYIPAFLVMVFNDIVPALDVL